MRDHLSSSSKHGIVIHNGSAFAVWFFLSRSQCDFLHQWSFSNVEGLSQENYLQLALRLWCGFGQITLTSCFVSVRVTCKLQPIHWLFYVLIWLRSYWGLVVDVFCLIVQCSKSNHQWIHNLFTLSYRPEYGSSSNLAHGWFYFRWGARCLLLCQSTIHVWSVPSGTASSQSTSCWSGLCYVLHYYLNLLILISFIINLCILFWFENVCLIFLSFTKGAVWLLNVFKALLSHIPTNHCNQPHYSGDFCTMIVLSYIRLLVRCYMFWFLSPSLE